MSSNPGLLLVLVGIVLIIMGLVWMGLPSMPWIGRLPGDFRIEVENGTFYFPIATCVLVSAVLTLTVWALSWLRR